MLSRRTLVATLPAAGLVTALPLPAMTEPLAPGSWGGLTGYFFWRCLAEVEGLSPSGRRKLASSMAYGLADRLVPVERMARLGRRGPLPPAVFWREHAALSRDGVVPVYDLGLRVMSRDVDNQTRAVQARHFAVLWAAGADPALCAVECIKRSIEETDTALGLVTRLTLEPADIIGSVRAIRTAAQ